MAIISIMIDETHAQNITEYVNRINDSVCINGQCLYHKQDMEFDVKQRGSVNISNQDAAAFVRNFLDEGFTDDIIVSQ